MVESQSHIEKAQSLPLPYSRWGAAKVHARQKVVNAVERFGRSPSSAPKQDGDEPVVLVGPVIGLVTQTTARILLEIDKDATVEMTLRKESEPEGSITRRGSGSFLRRGSSLKFQKSSQEIVVEGGVLRQEQKLPAKRARIFEFEDLTPKTRYAVQVSKCRGAVEQSSFRTFPQEPAQCLRIASISCNSIFITNKTITRISDLWSNLLTRIEGAEQLDLLVHIGDQIYGDGDRNLDAGAGKDRDKWSNRFKIAKHMLRNEPNSQWTEKKEEICEKYREVYRETWKHRETAKCLARCPNLMIYDDHEIRDNWGDDRSDQDKKSVDFFIAQCAWIVNLEYQRQLYEDVDFSNLKEIKKDYHFHLIGNVGLMFLDIRGSRTFHHEQGDEMRYLGSKQWEDIEKALGDDGIFAKAQVLVICSPAPLVFLVPAITKAAGHTVQRLEDFKGHWSAHKDEQVKMIKCLQTWKYSDYAKGREVLVLGGDVHCGGHSRILSNGRVLFYQLTTSPIANMPLPKSAYYVMRFAEQLGGISEHYSFSHFNWTRARNYGLVQIMFPKEKDDDGRTEIITQLVKGKFMRPITNGKKVSNLQVYPPTTCKPDVAFALCKHKFFSMVLPVWERTLFFDSRDRSGTVK